MTGRVESRLESHDYELVRQLHAVPPHEVYEVRLDGTRAVCKVAASPEADPATEARVIEHVREHTSVPVPEILATGDDWFVARWIDGLPDEVAVDEARARTMGAGLATLHEQATLDSPGFFQSWGPLVDAYERWSDVLVAVLADRRNYLEPLGYADVAQAAIDFVDRHREAFDPVDPVVVHGNYLPEHVGVTDADSTPGEVVAVIDFEHALAGAAEWDLIRTALPVHSNGGEAVRDALLAGYESVRSLDDGFDRRYEAYATLNTVSYLKALHLQDQHDPAEVERRAERMREHVYDSLDELDGELG